MKKHGVKPNGSNLVVNTPNGIILEGWVSDGADLDGEFVIETANGNFRVYGWLLDYSDIAQGTN